MSPKDRDNAAHLLHQFNVDTLGDGDLNAGANILASMALTIANVQRPGSAIVANEDGFRTPLGCSFVVSGALSCSLATDVVLAPLHAAQDCVFANVHHWEVEEKRRLDRLIRSDREVENEPENPPATALGELDRDAMFGEAEHTSRCLKLLANPPRFGFNEIGRHPLVFGIADSPDAFPRLMELAHLGRPLVHVALQEAVDCQAFQKAACSLLNGCQLFQPDIRSIRGELLVTDPGGALGEAVRGGLAGTSWLGRGLWLSDHAAGPDFESKAHYAAHARLDQVTTRFRIALRKTWAERLSAGEGKPAKMEANLRSSQVEWVKFLINHEPSFPGITGALRSLPASLLFGLDRLETARPLPADAATFDIGQVLAFARVLALRMINARAMMLRDSRRARIEALGESISRKLADGPLTVREITRRSHRLAASECEQTLEFLMARGRVTRTGNVWSLSQAAAPLPSTPILTVDV